MAGDILEQLKSPEVCQCEADLRAVARHEILRGRALAKAVKTFLIEIKDGEALMKDESTIWKEGNEIDRDAMSAAVEHNDHIRQRIAEIKQIMENGGV